MEELTKQAIDLVTSKNYSQSDIIKAIRKALIEKSKHLPPKKVLTCGSYGGFEYSPEFEEFAGYPEDRVKAVKHVKRFGEECCKKHPKIQKLLKAYYFNKLEKVFSNAYMLMLYKEQLASTILNKESIHASTETSKSRTLESCDNAIDRLKIQINNTCADLEGLPVELLERSINYKYQEEFEELKKPYLKRKNYAMKSEDSFFSFLEAIEQYGEDHWAIWKCQKHLNESAMRFLVEFPGVFEAPEDFEVYLEMGLLCASTTYCKLHVESVPQLLDWKIKNYDGFENLEVF